MATYTEYLDFDTEEDKLKQQQLYQVTELSAQTAAVVKRSAARKLAACRCAILSRLPRICAVYSKNGGVESQYPRQLYCPQRF